jgi:cytochrome c oxidase assembly factor 5
VSRGRADNYEQMGNGTNHWGLPGHRRGMIDMRKRFRGNQPISVSKEMEGGQSGNVSGGQLYAGQPAYQTVKELNGDEVQMDPEKTRGL